MSASQLLSFTAILFTFFHHISSSPLSLSNSRLISSQSSSTSLTNEYETDGDTYWKSVSQFRLIRDTSYGSLTLRHSFYMQFDLIWHGFPNSAPANNRRPFESIFRIGIPSESVIDCNGHATRYPALYLDKATQSLQFSLSDDIDCWGVGLLNVSYHNLQMHTRYTITIAFNQTWLIIQMNDRILYNAQRPGVTPPRMLYTPVSVMFSDSLDPAANMTLSDILIISYDDTLSMPPTAAPTLAPTVSTNVGTLQAIETSKTDTTNVVQTIGNADLFVVEIKIFLVFAEIDSVTLKTDIITDIIRALLPANTSVMNVTVSEATNVLHIRTETKMETRNDVTVLIAYCKNGNLTTDLITSMQTRNHINIESVTYEITIKEIYITNDESSEEKMRGSNSNNNFISFLPFNNEIMIYIVIGTALLCLCSFTLCICMWYRYCSLQHKSVSTAHAKHQKISTLSTIDIGDIDDDIADLKIKQEMQRLSQSLSVNNSGQSRSVEEVSLGQCNALNIPNSEGGVHQSVYQRVQTHISAGMDDDDTDVLSDDTDKLLAELTTDNFSDRVCMNETNASLQLQLKKRSSSKHLKLIKDQIRVTNQGFSETDLHKNNTNTNDDIDLYSVDGSLTHSSLEHMYDEGDVHITNEYNTTMIAHI